MITTHLPDEYKMPGHEHTLGEMREMIRKMQKVNEIFYGMAASTGCHTFIEFCGLQAKFIDLCRESLDKGIEFPFASTHSSKDLSFEPHHAIYLGEKFNCIWGHTIGKDQKLMDTFLKSAMGV